MHSVSSRIWTRVEVSISYDNNHYTTGTSKIVKMLLCYIITCYKFTKSQEKIYHFMYIDAIRKFVENQKELETVRQTIRIYSQNVRREFSIEKWAL